jgi:Helix-turn-helix domain
MGSGIGKTQQRILDALARDSSHRTLVHDSDGQLCAGELERDGMTVKALAELVGVSDRQVRTAVRALERRGLVAITKENVGRSGRGEYGPLVSTWWARNADLLASGTAVRLGENGDVLTYGGMPRAGLLVRLRDTADPMITRTPRRTARTGAALGLWGCATSFGVITSLRNEESERATVV